VVLGISLGATFVLRAVESEPDFVKAVVVVSADAQAADSDAAADAFIQEQSRRAGGRLRKRAMKLARPPYTDPAEFQRRTRLLADLGAIERGKSFNGLFRETLFSLIRTYGIAGAITSLRNMNLVQRRMLPELASLDLIATPPRVTVPVHYIYGERDALMPAAIVEGLPAAIAAPASSVTVVPNAGHQIHFDEPDLVRSITVRA
jgi:pimeloyl-ACP methyl ester carboxylesterase